MSNVQNLKIYDIIEQFEDLVENSPRPKLSGNATKRIVDVEEIMDLLGDLKTTIPEDIRRANGVIAESRSMLANAQEHARDMVQAAEQRAAAIEAEAQGMATQMLEKAKAEYDRLIAEDEIYQEAQKRAQLLAMKAEYSAHEVYEHAKTYADDILADLERFLGEYKRLVEVNRRDLDARTPQPAAVPAPVVAVPAAQPHEPTAQVVAAAPAAAAAPAYAAPKAAPQERPAPAKPNRGRKEEPLVEDFDDEDDFEEEDEERGGFLFGLFKKKKNFDEDDFEDEDEE